MIRLICSPFHLGHTQGMGKGPGALMEAGTNDMLERSGHEVEVRWVQTPPRDAKHDHETGAHFAAQRALAVEVRNAVTDGAFPMVLGGNCSSILGVIGGVPGLDSLLFFDAHADANTPETTDSGFLDGMPVAVATGRCWRRLAQQIPGFTSLEDDRVLLVGQRSIDDAERELLDASSITVVPAGQLEDAPAYWSEALASLATRATSTHLHIDLDVIDSADGLANEQWTQEPGPSLDTLVDAIGEIPDHLSLTSMSLTSYNPDVDNDRRAMRSAMTLLEAMAAAITRTTGTTAARGLGMPGS